MANAMRTNNVCDNILNRQFKEHGPRRVLLTDITYIPLCGAFCYLSVIMDAFTKQVIAYVLSESLEVDFVLETVNILTEKHALSLDAETLIHSDQGCHYTSKKFRQIVSDINLRQSMSQRGNCWDNAPQESFFGHMKEELDTAMVNVGSFDEAKDLIDDWMDYYNNDRMDYYNNDRPQWLLAKLSPNEYYQYITSGIYPLAIAPPLQ